MQSILELRHARRQDRPDEVPRDHCNFDYGSLPESLQRQAQERAIAIHELLGSRLVTRTAEQAVLVGLWLQAVRLRVGRNLFRRWLASEFQWRQSAASKFMRSAAVFNGIDCLDKFQPSAMYVLSRKLVPPAALDQTLTMARAGEFITKSLAESIVRQHLGASAALHAAHLACSALEGALEKVEMPLGCNTGPSIGQLAKRLAAVMSSIERMRGAALIVFFNGSGIT